MVLSTVGHIDTWLLFKMSHIAISIIRLDIYN